MRVEGKSLKSQKHPLKQLCSLLYDYISVTVVLFIQPSTFFVCLAFCQKFLSSVVFRDFVLELYNVLSSGLNNN